MRSKRLTVKDIPEWIAMYCAIAKDCLLTLVKSRLALGSPGCSFVRSSPCRKCPNTQKNGYWLPHSDHIHEWYPFSDQEWEIIGQASLLHGWHWILFNSSWVHCASGNFYHIFWNPNVVGLLLIIFVSWIPLPWSEATLSLKCYCWNTVPYSI